MNQPTIEIIKDPSVSIKDLQACQAEGISVLRSAHVGNLSPYNLTLAEAGVPILSVDHTVTGADKTYTPEQERTMTGSKAIAPLGTIVCRTTDVTGRYLDDRHLAAVRQAVPAANIYTCTEYLRRHETIAGEVVRTIQKVMPEALERSVTSQGTTVKDADTALMAYERYGIVQLQNDPRAGVPGALMPNIGNIVTNFVVEALETGAVTQYHLSGPDMVRYIGTMTPDIQRLYAVIKSTASLGPRLPDQMTVRLVPAAEAVFATTTARRPLLESVLDASADATRVIAEINAERSVFFRSSKASDPTAKGEFLSEAKSRQKQAERVVAAALSTIPELLAPAVQGITQYDVQQEGGLFVAPVNCELTMQQLAGLSKNLRTIQDRSQARSQP